MFLIKIEFIYTTNDNNNIFSNNYRFITKIMSCLFNSLAVFLDTPSQEIRKKICDYLEANNEVIEGLNTKDILKDLEYIKKMRDPKTWGSAIEINCACNIWNLQIIVKNIRDDVSSNIEFIPIGGKNSNTRQIKISWNGNHYEPIKDLQEKLKNKRKRSKRKKNKSK